MCLRTILALSTLDRGSCTFKTKNKNKQIYHFSIDRKFKMYVIKLKKI